MMHEPEISQRPKMVSNGCCMSLINWQPQPRVLAAEPCIICHNHHTVHLWYRAENRASLTRDVIVLACQCLTEAGSLKHPHLLWDTEADVHAGPSPARLLTCAPYHCVWQPARPHSTLRFVLVVEYTA